MRPLHWSTDDWCGSDCGEDWWGSAWREDWSGWERIRWNQFRFFVWSQAAASDHLARQLFTSGSNVSKSIFVACHLKRKVQSIEDFNDRLLSLFIICRLMSLKTEMFESTVKFRLFCIDGHTNNDVHLKNPLTEPTVFCWIRSREGELLTDWLGEIHVWAAAKRLLLQLTRRGWGGCGAKPNHGYNCPL